MMNAEEKVTKAQMFGMIREVLAQNSEANASLIEFVDKQVSDLAKRNSKETKTQKENKVLAEVVFNALDSMGKPVTVTELCKGSEDLSELSPQKVVALLKILINGGRVIRDDSNKKQTLFKVAEVVED